MTSSSSQQRFSQVPKAEIQRSSFDRSHGYKTTFDADFLYPIFVDEVLPGDTFNLNMTGFCRMATPIYPLMDNLYIDTFFFFVPNRLLWSNWKKFMGEQASPGDSTDFLPPSISNSGGNHFPVGSLGDYFGLPVSEAVLGSPSPSSLPFRAYNLIWNEWFRDQNLQDPAFTSLVDTWDVVSNFPLRKRGKRHDYFTSCLPWPQKGDAVSIPLGTRAPVQGIGLHDNNATPEADMAVRTTDTLSATFPWGVQSTASLTSNFAMAVQSISSTAIPDIWADLSEATAATINSLRQAFQIQKLLERDARGGTRYTELLRAHFGVSSPDARLQRPEYLGGGSTPISINPIHQTNSTEPGSTPLGQLSGIGTATMARNGFTQSFTEHGWVIGLCSVRADLNYQQGMNRMWNRSTRYDYYWPALAHIGEQAVLGKEIYTFTSGNDDVFGYQERYAEYRYKPSTITGLFRSQVAGTLDAWHLAQEFTARPLLNATFIESTTPMDRVVAVPGEPKFIFDGYFQYKCARPMPVYGVPGLIDHF